MGQILKITLVLFMTMLAQLYAAPMLSIADVRPDFILVLIIFLSSRYGRFVGITIGFLAGLSQDISGSLTVLGANALAKSVVGYTVGTLNGNLAVWTPKVINLYIFGSILGHALIYQTVMVQGLDTSWGILATNILIEALISSILVISIRYMLPLVSAEA
ncbi:MAG: rod shape-determining protein MreD [Candidatus Marinimicrobia bacterium]|nr:rod shape-determining protein MreD [Candidatus Neomarinimicrobiota bacterium]